MFRKPLCRPFQALLAAAVAFACAGAAKAIEIPFKIKGGGVAPEGLPLPGQEARPHWSIGEGTRLGRYSGDGAVQTDFALPVSKNALAGEFGGATPYVFTAADGSKLSTWYGRVDHGAAQPGVFELAILGATSDGFLIVEALFIAEFVVSPDDSTGRFAGATGSWIMIARTPPFILGSTDPLPYWWTGEGRISLVD
jgi:hypothetical protein